MNVKLKDGNIKDVEILDVTAENYIVPENEKHLFHVKIEQKAFNQNTGKRLSKPRVQKFGVKMYNRILDDLQRQGFSIEILYNPTEYLKQAEETKTKIQKQLSKAEEQKRIDDAVEKALKKQEEEFEKRFAALEAKLKKNTNK